MNRQFRWFTSFFLHTYLPMAPASTKAHEIIGNTSSSFFIPTHNNHGDIERREKSTFLYLRVRVCGNLRFRKKVPNIYMYSRPKYFNKMSVECFNQGQSLFNLLCSFCDNNK